MIIVIDTREKRNEHITNIYDAKGVSWIREKVDYGDYSCIIPSFELEYLEEDIDFRCKFAIERKKDWDEIVANLLAKNKVKGEYSRIPMRFERELKGALDRNIKLYLYLEENLADKNLFEGNFTSSVNQKFIRKRFTGLMTKYNVSYRNMSKNYSAMNIYDTLESECKEYLRNLGDDVNE